MSTPLTTAIPVGAVATAYQIQFVTVDLLKNQIALNVQYLDANGKIIDTQTHTATTDAVGVTPQLLQAWVGIMVGYLKGQNIIN